MSTPETCLCDFCKHAYPYEEWEEDEYGISIPRCPAFPDGIPDEVYTTGQGFYENEFPHYKKHPNQKTDIIFEPVVKRG